MFFVTPASGRRFGNEGLGLAEEGAGGTPAVQETQGQFWRPAFWGFCSMYLANFSKWDWLRTRNTLTLSQRRQRAQQGNLQ